MCAGLRGNNLVGEIAKLAQEPASTSKVIQYLLDHLASAFSVQVSLEIRLMLRTRLYKYLAEKRHIVNFRRFCNRASSHRERWSVIHVYTLAPVKKNPTLVTRLIAEPKGLTSLFF